MAREPRYWELYPAPAPGDVVAEHDGGVGLDPLRTDGGLVSGPGNYRLIVRRAGQNIPGDDGIRSRWPIELSPITGLTSAIEPFRFNPGMARWFGMRLIEAAAICETLDVEGGATPSVAPGEIERLATFLQENLSGEIGEGSAVTNAIRLLESAAAVGTPIRTDWQEKDRADLIEKINRLVQPETQLWHVARQLYEVDGYAADFIVYGLTETLGKPVGTQTGAYLRGVVQERHRRAQALTVNSQPKVESD